MSKHNALIDSLATDLQPSGRSWNINLLASTWLLFSAAYVVIVAHVLGPIRPEAITQLQNEPRFLLESLLGIAAITLTALSAFRAAVPGALSRPLIAVTAGLIVLWILNYVAGIYSPTLAPSMAGKREHCSLETFFYATPPMIAAFLFARRLYPLQPAKTALLAGLAAGMLPALYMQIACMYEPVHILKFHILPGLTVGFAALAVTFGWLKLRTSGKHQAQ
ncbi:MAG: NrsF family protein [Halioglobus sp.]